MTIFGVLCFFCLFCRSLALSKLFLELCASAIPHHLNQIGDPTTWYWWFQPSMKEYHSEQLETVASMHKRLASATLRELMLLGALQLLASPASQHLKRSVRIVRWCWVITGLVYIQSNGFAAPRFKNKTCVPSRCVLCRQVRQLCQKLWCDFSCLKSEPVIRTEDCRCPSWRRWERIRQLLVVLDRCI